MEINNTYLELIEGGNVFKQGDRVDLVFKPFNSKGEVVSLVGKTIHSTIRKAGRGILYEGTASWDFEKQAIVQRTPENLEHGILVIEFLVTDSNDPEYKTIFPSSESNGRLKVTPSAENMDFVGVKMTTVTQLRQEQEDVQQAFEAAVIPRVETVESQQAQLTADYQAAAGALTEDSEVILARGEMPTLGARLDDAAEKLADKAEQAALEIERARISNLTANAGNTDGNAELMDIRVGFDGITYPTAGDATRALSTYMKSENESWVV